MKYSEFLQLNEILETSGTTLDMELSSFKLNEADENVTNNNNSNTEIETEKGGIFTKWGRIKRTLNKTAKKTQQQIIKNVVAKYLPNILKIERQVTEALSQAIKENKKGKELEAILENKAKLTRNLQDKQLKALFNYVDKILNNVDASFEKKINSSESSKSITQILDTTSAFFKGGKDSAILKLKNYWQLLHTQIQMNVYNYVQQAIENDARKVLGNNENLVNYYTTKVIKTSSINSEINNTRVQANNFKNQVKQEETEAKNEYEDGEQENDVADI